MTKNVLIWIIDISLGSILSGQNNSYPKDYFSSPLEIPMYLSGTFGELRSNHFHSGIDIKTEGDVGLKVLAAANGVVSRIKVSPYGFGKAIYITHSNGYITVYAHLQRFNDKIKEYVRNEQYCRQTFALELFPSPSIFPVKKGELIAFSGNSGGSKGPHLHFEIRDSKMGKIINPLLFGFNIEDREKPNLQGLKVYNFSGGELVNVQSLRLLETSPGTYRLMRNDTIEVSRSPAFGILTYDRLTRSSNKNGVYSIKMWIRGKLHYDFKMETFSFNETRYINSHIGYGQHICCQKMINKLYIEPGNKLSVYNKGEPMNLPILEKDSIYDIRIQVSDIAGNISELVFNVVNSKQQILGFETEQTMLPIFKYNQPNFFKKSKIELIFPENALYKNIFFEHKEIDPCDKCLSAIHQVGFEEIPVHLYYTLKIKPFLSYKGDFSKLAIASFKDDGTADYKGGKYKDGFVSTYTRQFGKFAVVVDTTSPKVVSLNFSNGTNISSLSLLKVKITDDLSGINKYTPTLDDKWVLMEYDAKNDLLILDTSILEIEAGKHTLKLLVEDKKKNTTSVSYSLK